MIQAVKQAIADIKATSISISKLVSIFEQQLELTRQQLVTAQEHSVNAARERNNARMRAWRAAHKKSKEFANGRDPIRQ